MGKFVLLKLGGSLITDKSRPFSARHGVIRRLAREIRQALADRPDLRLVLGHGSGSFGHAAAHKHHTHRGATGGASWRGYAETAAAAARLNRLVTDLLLAEEVPVVSFQPSASARCRDGELTYLDTHAMMWVLDAGLVPLVHGDVAVDAVKGFTIISTEQIFACIAGRQRVDRIILASLVDGVYDADPLSKPNATRFREITVENWGCIETTLAGSHATDVTGGMLSKVRDMFHLVLAFPGLRAHIISGERPGHITSALLDDDCDIGTLIH